MRLTCRLFLLTSLLCLVLALPGYATVLKVGIREDTQTLEYFSTEGAASGVLSDLWHDWAQKSGHTIEFVPLGDRAPQRLLEDGTIDILANAPPGMQAAYSLPYTVQPYFFFTRRGGQLSSLTELPIKIGVLASDAPFLMPVLKNRGQTAVYQGHSEMLKDLQQGQISVMATNDIALNFAIPTTALLGLNYPEKPFYTHPVRAATLENGRWALNEFSTSVKTMSKAHRSSLEAKWRPSTFGFRLPWPLIGGAIIVLVASTLILFFWLMNSRLEQQVKTQTLKIEQQKRDLELDIERRKNLETELKAAKSRADAAAEEKSRFLATMTHELRTPLVGVLGMNELLQKTELTQHQRSLLDTVQGSGETLLDLVNDLLDFSKLDTSNLNLRLEPFNLPELVSKTIDVLREQAIGKNLALNCQIAPDARWKVLGDPLRLRQVLLNLLSNAVKFTLQGEVNVSLELLERSPQEGLFSLGVKDTGIGMPADVRDVIFTPFVQAENGSTTAAGGTGLGLAIVKQLVGLMSGTIELETQPGVGSLFLVKLRLPLVDQVSDSPAIAQCPDVGPTSEGHEHENTQQPRQQIPPVISTQRILVVDDYPVTRQLVKHSLAECDLQIDEADNGNQVLELTESVTYGLILMDRSMPQLDGLETTRRLRARGYSAPIVALTAHSDNETIKACLEAGMDDFLPKPFRQKQLFKTLSDWLESDE